MEEWIVDEKGKWLIRGKARLLIEPSKNHLEHIRKEQQIEEEKEMLESLKPSTKETLMAELQLNTINLLLEMEVI
ncbi:hypothetical protein ACR77J_08210 [Tissierella praeacuta]|uniref:hypothetical protein n=1 Tax=Tissierella praeacuta TaxID=43131 RepID=UPI003DA2F88A